MNVPASARQEDTVDSDLAAGGEARLILSGRGNVTTPIPNALPLVNAWQPGDVLACHGRDLTSAVIRSGTRWPLDPWSLWKPPSHVGIITRSQRLEGQPVLVESTTLNRHPCLIRGTICQGAQVQHIHERIDDYTAAGGSVDVYRLVGIHALDAREAARLEFDLVESFVHKFQATYDMRGALISAAKTYHLLNWMPKADQQHLFCSELIAAALMRIGLLNQANPAWYNPGRLIHELLRLGKYERIHTFTAPLSDPITLRFPASV
ncbi:hypothetical protein KOR42_45080 [Thalassoglobus neptunius]|uniref:Uncharacterized protein n=1 Tax=Thalassoglobus neptunius TaxID=1938619 RepID=A0A5C5VWP9_9PLAN|nr:hypothetical protein [Thalassoglobus neptunius]TWT43048.1 hypothetical protein KOR42_45080 [Thalassoglobus neptunius]